MRRLAVILVAIVASGCQAAASATPSPAVPAPTAASSRPQGTLPASAAAAPSASTPSTSPATILFNRKVGDGHQLWVAGTDGSALHQLLPGEEFDVSRWSPDGRQIAVTIVQDPAVFPAILAADGTGRRDLRPDPTLNCGAPTWAPDGSEIALECWDDAKPERTGIYLEGVDGKTLRRLTSSHGIPGQFAPDGTRLVYRPDDGVLHVVGVDGTHDRTLGVTGSNPGWLPDGRTLYAADGGLVLLTDQGQVLRRIAAPNGNVAEPDLSPDGTKVVFSFDLDDPNACCMSIATMGIDGTGFTEIVPLNAAEQTASDWRRMP